MSEVMTVSGGSSPQCPIGKHGAAYKPFDHAGMYEFFAQARREEPVFYCPDIGYWVVTRREDVLAILRNPSVYSAAPATEPLTPFPRELLDYLAAQSCAIEPIQVSCDRPLHTRIRRLATQYLNPKTFTSLEPAVRELARGYIRKMRGQPVVDVVAGLTYEFPARVVFLLLGAADIDPIKIKKWSDNRLMMTWGRLSPDELMVAAKELSDFFQFSRKLVEDRMRAPGDDYPSRMLAIRNGDDSALTINETVNLVFGLLLAGHETTTNASTNLILELLERPQQWARLVADPALIPKAVEEGLRYASSVVNWRRLTLQDVEIAGVAIPKGARILVSLASANHDDAHFVDAESFDIARPDSQDHVAFGSGIHFCLGAPLARLEMRVILEGLTKSFPGMRLVPDQTLNWIRTISFRGPEKLLVHPDPLL